jgi:hypothetical protein
MRWGPEYRDRSWGVVDRDDRFDVERIGPLKTQGDAKGGQLRKRIELKMAHRSPE